MRTLAITDEINPEPVVNTFCFMSFIIESNTTSSMIKNVSETKNNRLKTVHSHCFKMNDRFSQRICFQTEVVSGLPYDRKRRVY